MPPNKLLVCPYDESHRIKPTRYQLHIIKCKPNHLNEKQFVCPFNATHVMSLEERNFHLSHCIDKAPLDRRLSEIQDKYNPKKGRTAVPCYSECVPVKDNNESWDEEAQPLSDNAPDKEQAEGAFFQLPPLLFPHQRKILYQELLREADKNRSAQSELFISPPIPRQPKAIEAGKHKAASNIFGNAGIGRGRVLQSSIAANINLHAVEPSKMPSVNNKADLEPNDYKDLERNGSQESTTASLNPLSAFAALGLGRGMNRFRGQNDIKVPVFR